MLNEFGNEPVSELPNSLRVFRFVNTVEVKYEGIDPLIEHSLNSKVVSFLSEVINEGIGAISKLLLSISKCVKLVKALNEDGIVLMKLFVPIINMLKRRLPSSDGMISVGKGLLLNRKSNREVKVNNELGKFRFNLFVCI